MQKSFSKGYQVRLTPEAVENYGNQWENVTLEIAHIATRHMPAGQFFGEGKPEGYHPGFDSSSDSALYDLKILDGNDVPFSLYDWELEDAN